MLIHKDTVVTIRYRVDDANGIALHNKATEAAYLHGGYGNIIEKIEATLEGQTAGFAATIDMPPDDGFGQRDEKLVKTISREQLPAGTKVGGQLQLPDPEHGTQVYHITKIKGKEVMLDGNHPLAGKHVKFVVRVLSVRAATQEEIEHKHAHGAHGHHH